MNTSVDPCSDFDRYVCSKCVYAEGDVPFTGVMGYGLKKWEDSLEDKLSHATQYIKYASHVQDVYRKCMGDVSTAESRKSIHQLKKFMRELRLPWPEAPPAGVEPLEVDLHDIGAHTINITTERWRKALQASSPQSFLLSDSVTFSTKASLKALNSIFLHHNNTALLKGLSWTFILVFCSITDRDFLTLKFGTLEIAREQRRSFCATELDAAYRWIIVSLLVTADFPRQSRDAIDASFDEITCTVVSLLKKAFSSRPNLEKALSDKVDPRGRITDSWLPAGTKATLAEKASFLGPDSCNYSDFFPEMAVTQHDRSMKVFPALSEDQLFFVVACITVCSLANVFPVELRVSCNKAVSGMPTFAKAFRCPKGGAMNGANK
ncbi:hypothetical protein HPB51_017190 [Rhipicephalus microplus]|uniref:Uncharacterized protein n=1 Tax=Rhipicephalus microplus TaxID=6941 RepID=A0A9J6EAR8_RHIMP|nr:hypothetical protein HPB51_017190 [Rhipicephalus microplus]